MESIYPSILVGTSNCKLTVILKMFRLCSNSLFMCFKSVQLKVTLKLKDQRAPDSLSVAAEVSKCGNILVLVLNTVASIILCNKTPTFLLRQVFEISPTVYVVELRKTHGDSTVYRQVSWSIAGSSTYPLPLGFFKS